VAVASPYKFLGNVAPVKNVPVKVAPTKAPVQTRQYFGTPSAADALGNQQYLQANFGYKGDVPGTPANPSTPYVDAHDIVKPATPGHWNTTDWAAMIPGDWEVTGAEAAGNKMQGEAEASFQKALRQAFIDYGGDSSKLGDYAKYIDDPTIQAAQNNKFSQTAQNLAAMTKGLRQSRAALAARGIGSSGANTEQTRRALEAKEQGDYTAMRSFLSGADEGTAGLATMRQTIADKIAAARSSAAARLAAAYPNTWEEGTPEETITVPGSGGVPTNPPAAAAAAKPISWGSNSNITTKAQLIAQLGPGVSYATWAANHPAAAARLR
jgi:hypothetical protein